MGEARALVKDALSGWHVEGVVDDLLLVASELVSNALRHALGVAAGSSPSPAGGGPGVGPERHEFEVSAGGFASGCGGILTAGLTGPNVWISLVRTAGHVICEVADPSRRPPVRREADPMSGCGQGLALVESLSTCWGWNAHDEGGKSVWAIVPLSPARLAA